MVNIEEKLVLHKIETEPDGQPLKPSTPLEKTNPNIFHLFIEETDGGSVRIGNLTFPENPNHLYERYRRASMKSIEEGNGPITPRLLETGEATITTLDNNTEETI